MVSDDVDGRLCELLALVFDQVPQLDELIEQGERRPVHGASDLLEGIERMQPGDHLLLRRQGAIGPGDFVSISFEPGARGARGLAILVDKLNGAAIRWSIDLNTGHVTGPQELARRRVTNTIRSESGRGRPPSDSTSA